MFWKKDIGFIWNILVVDELEEVHVFVSDNNPIRQVTKILVLRNSFL